MLTGSVQPGTPVIRIVEIAPFFQLRHQPEKQTTGRKGSRQRRKTVWWIPPPAIPDHASQFLPQPATSLDRFDRSQRGFGLILNRPGPDAWRYRQYWKKFTQPRKSSCPLTFQNHQPPMSGSPQPGLQLLPPGQIRPDLIRHPLSSNPRSDV
jgi:hypothetical protein